MTPTTSSLRDSRSSHKDFVDPSVASTFPGVGMTADEGVRRQRIKCVAGIRE